MPSLGAKLYIHPLILIYGNFTECCIMHSILKDKDTPNDSSECDTAHCSTCGEYALAKKGQGCF